MPSPGNLETTFIELHRPQPVLVIEQPVDILFDNAPQPRFGSCIGLGALRSCL